MMTEPKFDPAKIADAEWLVRNRGWQGDIAFVPPHLRAALTQGNEMPDSAMEAPQSAG
jgi:hypothetical protein